MTGKVQRKITYPFQNFPNLNMLTHNPLFVLSRANLHGEFSDKICLYNKSNVYYYVDIFAIAPNII